jgi:ABC-type multidrug transport system ATPase subunit
MQPIEMSSPELGSSMIKIGVSRMMALAIAISEELVFEAIDRLVDGKTVIVIAHRFSTIQRAHRIFVIGDGRIVESGTHEQLLPSGGLYAKLYELQVRQQGNVPVLSLASGRN